VRYFFAETQLERSNVRVCVFFRALKLPQQAELRIGDVRHIEAFGLPFEVFSACNSVENRGPGSRVGRLTLAADATPQPARLASQIASLGARQSAHYGHQHSVVPIALENPIRNHKFQY
jgi:hypothetical protein